PPSGLRPVAPVPEPAAADTEAGEAAPEAAAPTRAPLPMRRPAPVAPSETGELSEIEQTLRRVRRYQDAPAPAAEADAGRPAARGPAPIEHGAAPQPTPAPAEGPLGRFARRLGARTVQRETKPAVDVAGVAGAREPAWTRRGPVDVTPRSDTAAARIIVRTRTTPVGWTAGGGASTEAAGPPSDAAPADAAPTDAAPTDQSEAARAALFIARSAETGDAAPADRAEPPAPPESSAPEAARRRRPLIDWSGRLPDGAADPAGSADLAAPDAADTGTGTDATDRDTNAGRRDGAVHGRVGPPTTAPPAGGPATPERT
ncbi:MAG: hypothetical protein ACKVWR_02715, partial [Acidimicrobiales bacterium]